MRSPFLERTQVQYTTNGSKVCTYKDATAGYCVTCQQPNRGTEVMAYLKRADAMRRLERVIAENGGVTDMHTYKVYAKVYDTVTDYRAGNYHYMTVTVTAKDTIEAEVKAARNYFSFSLVSIEEKGVKHA